MDEIDGWYGGEDYNGWELLRWVVYPRAPQDVQGGRAAITEEERIRRQVEQDTRVSADHNWKREKQFNYCYSTPTASPVHLGHMIRSVTLALLYRVVWPMA